MTTSRGGRPRMDHVPVVALDCPHHGRVQGRVHKIGRRPDGEQRYRTRCPACAGGPETNPRRG